MRIKKCSIYIKEASLPPNFEYDDDENENPDYMYHSTEKENIKNILYEGLKGEIYLTTSLKDAKRHHPWVLRIDVRDIKLRIKEDGSYVANYIPPGKIELWETDEMTTDEVGQRIPLYKNGNIYSKHWGEYM